MRHAWRLHETKICRDSNRNFTCDDVSSKFDRRAYTCLSDRHAATVSSCAPATNVTGHCLALTGEAVMRAATDDAAAEVYQASGDAAVSTLRSSNTSDEVPPYRFRLVAASASRTSSDNSHISRTTTSSSGSKFSLLSPPMKLGLSEQQAACLQSWNSAWTSAGCQHGKPTRSRDWLCRSVSSTFGSSHNCLSSSPLSVDDLKPDRSGMDYYTRLAVDQPAVGMPMNPDRALFKKLSTRTKSRRSSAVRFSCPVCPLSYKRVADLNRHMKQKHWTSLKDFNSLSTRPVSVSTARNGPLDLTLQNTDSQSACQTRSDLRSHSHREDTPQDLPLDLSVISSDRLKSNNRSDAGQSSELLSNGDSDWRFSSNPLWPSFISSDAVQKMSHVDSRNPTPSCHCNAVSPSAGTIPSFYASFAKFMEINYNPLWKSYFDVLMRTSENKLTHQCDKSFDSAASVVSDDLMQGNEEVRRTVDSKMTGLSGPMPNTDKNNNNSSSKMKYDFADQCNISADGADAVRPCDVPQTELEEEDGEDDRPGSRDGGTWGQCPLCPFVCAHPLVMRCHLDVHDEPELERAGRAAVSHSSSTASFELGFAGRQNDSFDVTGGLTSFFHAAGRSSASTEMSSCLPWRSTFAAASDGNCTRSVSVLTGINTSRSFPARLSSASGAVSEFAGRHSTPANWIGESVGLRSAARQTVLPFLSGSQVAPVEVEDARSTPANDASRHVAAVRSAGGCVVTVPPASTSTMTLSPSSWVAPVSSHAAVTGLWCVPQPSTTPIIGPVGWQGGWVANGNPPSTFPHTRSTAVITAYDAATFQSKPASHLPWSTPRTHLADFKVTCLLFTCQ